MDEDIKNKIAKLKKILKRDIYTTRELIDLGIFGSKQGVYDAMANGKIEYAYISNKRIVIFTDSLLKHIENILYKKKEDKDK